MTKVITVDHITKIEGHAKMCLKVDDGKLKKLKLKIFEGSRYFEGMLIGKKWNDLAHITSRICGVCSPVHMLTSTKAIEDAFGINVSEQSRLLREVLNIGGIIQSHVLHLYFLAWPDYEGYESAIQMASKYKDEISRALNIKRAANLMVNTIGGRDVHPLTVVPGGFSVLPSKDKVAELIKALKSILKDAKRTMELFCCLPYSSFEHKVPYFALSGRNYFDSDKIVSCDDESCFTVDSYEDHFKEYFTEGSTAEFVTQSGKSYMVGALPRLINNTRHLSKESQKYVKKYVSGKKYYPYMNNVAQAIELYEGVVRSIDVLENLKLKDEKVPEVNVRKAVGYGASEAPRGILFHKYEFDAKGICRGANITTPTSQNLQLMEDALRAYIPSVLGRGEAGIILEAEKLIRAYDPCISCSTHFLEVEIDGLNP